MHIEKQEPNAGKEKVIVKCIALIVLIYLSSILCHAFSAENEGENKSPIPSGVIEDETTPLRITLVNFFNALFARGLPAYEMFSGQTRFVIKTHMKYREKVEALLADAAIDGIPEEKAGSFVGFLLGELKANPGTKAIFDHAKDLKTRQSEVVAWTKKMRGTNRPIEDILPVDWEGIRRTYVASFNPIIDEAKRSDLAASAVILSRVERVLASIIDQAPHETHGVSGTNFAKIILYQGYLERCDKEHALIELTWKQYKTTSKKDRLLYQLCHRLAACSLQEVEDGKILDEEIVKEAARLIAPLMDSSQSVVAHEADVLLACEFVETVWQELATSH